MLEADIHLQTMTRRGGLVGTILVACAYAYGMTAETDKLLDRSPPRSFRATVLDKSSSGGVKSPRTWHFTVSAWGPRAEGDEITVSSDTFSSIRRGETVCIALGPGALGIPWYEGAAC